MKEAAYKALYPTIRPTCKELSYHSFSSDFPGSKPSLTFSPTIAVDGNRVGELLVSVSHDGEYIFSTVVAQRLQ